MNEASGDHKVTIYNLEVLNNNKYEQCGGEGDVGHDIAIKIESFEDKLMLESTAGPLDSGHFTVTPPETENSGSGYSGSPRSHSPTLPLSEMSSELPNTASLIMQVSEDDTRTQLAMDDQNSTSSTIQSDPFSTSTVSLSSKDKPHSNSVSSHSNSKIITQHMPTTGEGDKSTEYLKSALDNFNSLYEEKLKMIDDYGAQGDADNKEMLMEKKAYILECWAKDICVQNILLIHTVEELEMQSEQKLKQLQKKIYESTNLAKQHITVIQKYESKIKTLMTDKETSEVEYKALKRDLDKLRSEFKRTRNREQMLEKDNENLVTLITRIRDMGVWDVAGLELYKRTFEHIFGLYPNLPGSEVQTVFTRERARKIKQNEDQAGKLKKEVSEMKTHIQGAEVQLINKDSKITELETEFKSLSEKLENCQDECEHYKKSLIETQEKLLEATKELQVLSKKRANTPTAGEAARHAEIQELLHELRDVKSQLTITVHERQSAKEEANIIKKEFNERLKAMCESQREITHTFETQNQVQEKEMELLKVKEQMQLYQSKCHSAEEQLVTKDQLIEELQKQILQLNEKISDIKDEWKRVFSNFNPSTGSGTGSGEIVKESSDSESELSPVEQCMEGNSMPGCVLTIRRESNCIKPDSEEYKKIVKILKKDFEAEKFKMEDDFQRVLVDKDIEITMQKVTIQHLQDALVALKRGQPIPVPQNSDRSGRDNAFEHSFRTGSGLNDSGVGRACLGELINNFEDLKSSSLDNLQRLRHMNSLLSAKSSWMEKKLVLFGHLISMQELLDRKVRTDTDSSDIIPNTIKSPRKKSLTVDPKLATALEKEVLNMKNVCTKLLDECVEEAENVESLTKLDETLKTEIAELQWQLERFRILAGELEIELVGVKEQLSELKNENDNLKIEKANLEEDLLATQIEIMDIKNSTNENRNEGYFSPLKRLHVMKSAFDKNEETITKYKADIEQRNKLIDMYHKHCQNLQKVVVELTAASNESQASAFETNEHVKILEKKHIKTLGEAHEAHEKLLCFTNDENLKLKETVTSLNHYIEELLHQNDKLESKLMGNLNNAETLSVRDSILSDDSTPPFSNKEKKKVSAIDNSQGSGDGDNSSRELIIHHLQVSEASKNYVPSLVALSKSDFIPTNPCKNPHVKNVYDLSFRLGKCAENLGRSSAEIISTSLNLTNMNPNSNDANNSNIVNPKYFGPL